MTLEIISSPALRPLRHGFFTRKGGASSGVYEGLNCGMGSGDRNEAVAINRSRAAEALDVPPEALKTVHQTHSSDVVVAEDIDPETRPRADAMVSATPGVALAILTADCQPVLLADHEAGVIGAAHAGWRGTLEGVLEAALDAMESLGAQRGRVAAAIGPSISQAMYEVGQEFLDAFLAQDPASARFFANGKSGRYLFDLPGYGIHRLRGAKVGHAEWTRHCTYSDPDRFYSYRRSRHRGEADYGRLLSSIRL